LSRIPVASLANGVLFATEPFASPSNPAGVPLLTPAVGCACNVYTHDTITPVTVYAAETGGTVVSQPLVSASDGSVPGWVDPAGLPLDLVVHLSSGDVTYVLASGGGSGSGVTVSSPAQGQVPVFNGTSWGPGTAPVNWRGEAQYSTTYYPGDVVLYVGEYILITAQVTTGSGTNGLGLPAISSGSRINLTSQGYFWASDYGVASGNADNWLALQSLLLLVRSLASGGSGFKVILPNGYLNVSKTIVVPTHTMIEGQGMYSTSLNATGPGYDVCQTECYGSASQAALLTTANGLPYGVAQASLVNAFRCGFRDLCFHGTVNGSRLTAPGDYHHGLNITLSPATTTAPGDPDFDPAHLVENCLFRANSGDGYYHYGRSATRLVGCVAWFNNGNGFSPSFDTQHIGSQAGFNGGAGWYFNHGANQGSGNKSYNNGQGVNQWVSGSNYAVGQRVVYSGAFYDAINVLTDDTVAPSSDATNWQHVTATSPQAWGRGVYMDTYAAEITFNCDTQENSADSWYFNQCNGGAILATGVTDQPNFNNTGGSGSGSLNPSNPNHYAEIALDGCQSVMVQMASNYLGTAGAHLRIVNGATKNDVVLVSADNAGFVGSLLTSDSTAIAGSGNAVRYNGTSYTVGLSTATGFAPSGLTGATAAGRYVGTTASGAPASGAFLLGDWITDETGKRWTCTTPGSPGTWTQEPGTAAPSGATVTRNSQLALRDIVSIKDFGAVGDGSTDDSAAILAAIAYAQTLAVTGDSYAPTMAAVVDWPTGYYRTSKPILIPEGVWCRGGLSRGAVSLAPLSGFVGPAVVANADPSGAQEFVGLTGIGVYGNFIAPANAGSATTTTAATFTPNPSQSFSLAVASTAGYAASGMILVGGTQRLVYWAVTRLRTAFC
jgi:hypothetical protein